MLSDEEVINEEFLGSQIMNTKTYEVQIYFNLNSKDFGTVYILHGIQVILDPLILILCGIQRDLGA